MAEDTRRPEDQNPHDPDKPVLKDTAADHRPDRGDDGTGDHRMKGPEGPIPLRDQDPSARMPHPSRLQKQQRSPNMNTEKYKGRKD